MIEGYVGKPSVLKSTRAWQTCIVNQRIVHNPLMFKAIENAYHAMLPKSGYPFVMMHVHVDPATIDVNVHPSKTEIKFADEQAIYRAIYHSIVTALVAQEKPENIAATVELPAYKIARIEEKEQLAVSKEPAAGMETSTLPFDTPRELPKASLPLEQGMVQESQHTVPSKPLQERLIPAYGTAAAPAHHAVQRAVFSIPSEKVMPHTTTTAQTAAFSQALAAQDVPSSSASSPVITFDGDEDVFIPLGEVADCFIIAKKGQDLYIVDQHAAHERIRYDTFCKRVEKMPSQQLLTAEFVEVDAEDMTLLLERRDVFEDLGYTYSEAGPTTLRVEEVPCDLQTSDIADSLKDICQALHEDNGLDKATLRHRSLAYLSCHGAIKAGDTLNIRQMKQLLEDLFHTDKPYVCPHGRPIIVRFTPDELAKLFKRT